MRILRIVGYIALGAAVLVVFVAAVSGLGYVIRTAACDLTRFGGWWCSSSHVSLFDWGAGPLAASLVCAVFGWGATEILKGRKKRAEGR